MLSIAICDDEKEICRYIEKRTAECLAKADEEARIQVFSDGTPLLEACRKEPNSYDIIFLDIKMKTINGVECAKLLRETGVEALIVFVTSSVEYVFSGYEVKAFRYILKNDLVNAFDRIFGECLEELRRKAIDFFSVKTASEVRNIALNDIMYFESNRRLLTVHTRQGETTFYGKLDDIQKNLLEKDFIRTHQSFLVNALKIKSIKKDNVELADGTVLPVSKSRATAVKEAYLWSKR